VTTPPQLHHGLGHDPLIEDFGTPYYVKIDIEGNDLIALEGLASVSRRPKYVSIESEKDSFRGLRREISVMQSLGYDSFKIIDQKPIPGQFAPRPSREGKDVVHRFARDSSGAFGADLAGPWLNADDVVDAYKSIFLRYALTGDDPFVQSYTLRRVLRRCGFGASWYDTHARLSTLSR
jgi:hypothetical protein